MNHEPNLVVIGVSTGGPVALKEIFSSIPSLDAAIIVVMHIGPRMDRFLARGLAAASTMPVSLAENGDMVESGRIYMSPGGYHLRLEANRRVVLYEGERVNHVQPSADVAMLSVRKSRHARIVGVVLTGMGKDGAEGVRHIKRLGGATIAQNRESSAIFGMPKAAVETGAIDFVLPADKIGRKLVQLLEADRPARR